MGAHIEIDNELVAFRLDRVDHAPGDRLRRFYRDANNGRRRRDRHDPFNEAFSFTYDEYELLKKIRPDLFDGDPQTRTKRWREFANTSEGRAFRIR